MHSVGTQAESLIHPVCFDDVSSVMKQAGFETWALAGNDVMEAMAVYADPADLERYGLHPLQSVPGALVVAFPYDPRPVRPAPGHAGIAAFARRNRYHAMARLLGVAGRSLALLSGLPARGFRAVVNSRLPEKELAILAGLGFAGRSSLVVTDAYGPSCLLGALLLPDGFRLTPGNGSVPPAPDGVMRERKAMLVPGSGCGGCVACVGTCPTGAIELSGGGVSTEKCLQFWATKPGTVPQDVAGVWGAMLYGCDVCVSACPHSVNAYSGASGSPAIRAENRLNPDELLPGESVPVGEILEADNAGIRARFRGTALGMSWITPDCLRRNAMMAQRCGGTGDLPATNQGETEIVSTKFGTLPTERGHQGSA